MGDSHTEVSSLSDTDTCEDVDVETFTDDEELIRDTTHAQLARGKDMQGIPWELMQYTRPAYRAVRDAQYRNYFNLEEDVNRAQPAINAEALRVEPVASPPFYDFYRNWRSLRSTIVHFQLRNLLWAVGTHGLYLVHENSVLHWDTAMRRKTVIMDVSGGVTGAVAPSLGQLQVCTLCAREGLVAAGGFGGELVARSVGSSEPFACSMRVTTNENGITNAIEIVRTAAGALRVVCSNNDCAVRQLDGETFKLVSQVPTPWAVNCTVAQPGGGKLMCSVGDDPVAMVFDGSSGVRVADLAGHSDYSFAAAWHPGGNVIATGNQDMTARLWDIRAPHKCLALLKARIGAVRSLRFSPCGRFLAAAEPADYITLYDAAAGYTRCQPIDVFGELAGISFSPDGERLFAAVSDVHYSSVLQFDRHRERPLLDGWL